ncbi:subtilisin-like protease [Musa troglodytarum]|uniref:Subtilisin-like protease n=1 Tax=Musa troglodytarum TaxID=320322 RepID=A0A9E7ERN6_9LILI|nr:subtilisin-like protease [Musa troglodytarum]
MSLSKHALFLVLYLCASFLRSGLPVDGSEEPKAYIVHVKGPERVGFDVADQWSDWYSSLLEGAEGDPRSRLIYSYRNVMTGFAARLTPREVEALSTMDWFLHAYPSRVYRLQTTHTPEFLGLRLPSHGMWNESNMGEGIIIGLLDTGVTPGHPSYDDHGMPPPPAKWKGRCDLNASACNNKLIGARSFISYDTPVDEDGHGTHTSSTAAGAFVKRANVNGFAPGVAAGMAPRAHIAAYKVCHEDSCMGHDMLAALDAAVDDGVDVISFSIAADPIPFHSDPIAQGTFNAISKGVFISCSAGNEGPDPGLVNNDAPWLLTVGASTTDRVFLASVKLGNGRKLDGESLHRPLSFKPKMLPLVYPGFVTAKDDAYMCSNGTLDGVDVRGKIVLCQLGIIDSVQMSEVVKKAGGAGMIVINYPVDGYSIIADDHVLPASMVPYAYGVEIQAYINSTSTPIATIINHGTAMHRPHSPDVASFSSRGPSQITPGILKPDIIGPGVNILAGWNSQAFALLSGTSMSCPHLSGIAALIKKAHPGWSPAAIKSAIMTTASVTDNTGGPILDEQHRPADLFAVGAGHVNARQAIDPGLVYDLTPEDYVPYLCGLGYNDSAVSALTRKPVRCSSLKSISQGELNYPSISVTLQANSWKSVSYTRTVTNVGKPTSIYAVKVDMPKGVSASVTPTTLSFEKVNQKKSFSISFRRSGGRSGRVGGQLRWVSRKHVVRSPISIRLK